MMKKATAVLDFGTSKVLVLLAEESAYQKVTITSAGMAQYDGFMNGEWNAPSEVSDAIASAIEAAEKKVGTHIKEVYVGVPGEFVRVYVIESSVALQGADPKVQRGCGKAPAAGHGDAGPPDGRDYPSFPGVV